MIRKYKTSDLERVYSIWLQASSIAHPFLEASFVEKIKVAMKDIYIPNSKTWVHEEENVVQGFVGMMGNEIGGLFISPDHQAKGIGTSLVNHVRDLYPNLEVEVFVKNEIGKPFYYKYGFEPLNEYFNEDAQQDVLRMKYTKS